jgi:predicted TIM-barrel fold metal-dependent hydrolase
VTPAPWWGRINDLDGHVMFDGPTFSEILGPDFDREIRPWVDSLAGAVTARQRDDARRRAEQEVGSVRGFLALGAVDADDRLRALDALGIARQLVLPPVSWPTLDDERPGARATRQRYNDWMAAWAAGRDRLVPVAQLALGDPAATIAEAERIAGAGFRAVEVPFAAPPGGCSPAADAWDPLWELLAAQSIAVVLHLGGAGVGAAVAPRRAFLAPGWYASERLAPAPFPRAMEALRENAKAGPVALATLHLPAEVFLTSLVLGGALERHPQLRVVVLEMGAQWVGAWVERLDAVAAGYRAFGLPPLDLMPSEVIRRQVRVTPFERNPLGDWLDRDGLVEVYAFASDYPHAEGGRDPVGRLQRALVGQPDEAAERFFVTNAAPILGPPPAPPAAPAEAGGPR